MNLEFSTTIPLAHLPKSIALSKYPSIIQILAVARSMSPPQQSKPSQSSKPIVDEHLEEHEVNSGLKPPGVMSQPSLASQSVVKQFTDDDASSQSVTSSVMQFPEENGRTYHGYRAGTYHFPNDINEQDRLEAQFDMLKLAFSGRNYFAALSDPKYILDVSFYKHLLIHTAEQNHIGTGTGQWAIQMGDTFPDAEVQATDLSPIQPSDVPVNVHFYIDDSSDEDWVLPPNYFDYIHTRVLLGCFENFDKIIKRAFHYTKPGAYMESQEIMFTPYCDDDSMPEDWPFLEWVKYVNEAAMEAGRPMGIANKLKKWYEDAGFVDVEEKVFKLPINPWPEDKHLKELGQMSEENWISSLSSFSLALFSRILDWKQDEIEVYLVNIRKSIPDRKVHAYHRVFVVWGRKPDEDEAKANDSVNLNTAGVEAAASSPAHDP